MYIDPGLGSMVILAIAGFVVAIPVYLAMSWRKVKSWFSRKSQVSETHQQES